MRLVVSDKILKLTSLLVVILWLSPKMVAFLVWSSLYFFLCYHYGIGFLLARSLKGNSTYIIFQ